MMKRLYFTSLLIVIAVLITSFILRSKFNKKECTPSPRSTTIRSQNTNTTPAIVQKHRSVNRAQPFFSLHKPVLSTNNLSVAVNSIIQLSHTKASYGDYHTPMRALSTNLSTNDTVALMFFLTQKAADHPEMRPIAFNSIKNDILDVLLRQDKIPDKIGALLADMYNDKTYDTMWRDYCIQYVANYCERKFIYADISSSTNSGLQTALSVYSNALTEIDSTIAGTALLGIVSLHQSAKLRKIDPNLFISKKQLQNSIEFIVNSPYSAEPARITALRVATDLQLSNLVSTARIIAQTGETTILRATAIATIADLGNDDDIELLYSLSADSEPRIKKAALRAIKKLTKG